MDFKGLLSKFIPQKQNNQDIWTNSQIIQGNTPENNYTPQYLVSLNSGWVSICNDKTSSTASSIPIKLYYHNKNNKNLLITETKEVSKSNTKKLIKDLNLKEIGKVEEVLEHPLLDLFNNINDTMNYYDWSQINFSYLGILGNAYNEIIYENNIPIAFNPLLSEFITPVATGKNQGKILYYLYKPDDKDARKLMPEQVLHFVQYQVGNTLYGRGDLYKCLNAQERYLYMDAYEKYLGINNNRPDFVWNLKAAKVNEKDLKDMYRQINKRFGGVENSGKSVIVAGDMDIKNLGFAPKDMQYNNGRQWSLKEIASAFGVPLALIQTEGVNYAQSNAAMNQYLTNTIYPKMCKFCSKINEQLTPLFDKDLYIWFSEEYIQDPKEKTDNTIALYNAGIITKNEARENIGKEPIIEEDVEEPIIEEEIVEEDTNE